MKINPQQLYKRCPICGLICEEHLDKADNNHVTCVCCGNFILSEIAKGDLEHKRLNPRQRANISGYIRENQGGTIYSDDINFLISLSAPSVAERAMRLLRHMAKQQTSLSQSLSISDWKFIGNALSAFERSSATQLMGSMFEVCEKWFPWLSVTWSQDFGELHYLLNCCLATEMDMVLVSGNPPNCSVTITPKGWSALENNPQGTTNAGFVAMWFNDEVKKVWEEALYPGIREAGYQPDRIDIHHHNNDIVDEILAAIRGAWFIVADFTGQRGGVYFEAGFAKGLGKSVIWTVRQDEVSKLHFDTRQFNHITWDPNDLPKFRREIRARIEATFGHGPLPPH